ncbi:polysaccharide pyruvyl transferase family protein [Clostridium sp.]|uniref:polysaccharide pyruvyl transferase family protein n=1 Tax=Clostridium sp. TaxID=1506 RepID=UPI0032163CC2
MKNVLLMDISVASLNKGDDIIMECVQKELKYFTKDKFILTLPTHVSPFHSYQIWRNSNRVQIYKNCCAKFVCGSNLLVPDMLTHFPQWNLNIFNYKAIENCVLVGVGVGAGEKTNFYTTMLYKRLLNKNLYHSVRDERSKKFLEKLGVKVINTGCATMWMFTPEFCKTIPTKKANNAIFTLTARNEKDNNDQILINILKEKYNKVYFWVQGVNDFEYINKFDNLSDITIINPTLSNYKDILCMDDLDYVGTRLHAGIYAMGHKKRSIIILIDERAREINKSNNLNCIDKDEINKLGQLIDSEFETKIKMPFENIETWKNQFK